MTMLEKVAMAIRDRVETVTGAGIEWGGFAGGDHPRRPGGDA